MTRPLHWTAYALCAQVDPEIWFPTKGDSPARAKAICARCAVRTPCLEVALTNPETAGVFGGTTQRERRRLRLAG